MGAESGANVEQAVPFLGVTDMARSLAFYTEGLGFQMTRSWEPAGKVRWCWLELGGAAVMLQEHAAGRVPAERCGVGVSLCFQCKDALALFHAWRERGLKLEKPQVGNAMWVVVLTDPDGYKLDFESPTEAVEESYYEG